MTRILKTFWADDTGAIIASEYMMVGSLVVLGSAGGLAAMRDSMTEEMKEYGHSVREVRQSYSPLKKHAVADQAPIGSPTFQPATVLP